MRIRPNVLAVVLGLNCIGVLAVLLGYVEVATACVGASAGIASRLIESEEKEGR